MYTRLDLKQQQAISAEKDAALLDGLDDFFKTYIVRPVGNEEFCFTIMADRGVPFEHGKVERTMLNTLLVDLKRKLMKMTEYIVHGDVLPHNLVHDSTAGSLHLIDYDEGAEKAAPGRSLNFESASPWFEALLYPNALRGLGAHYTTVQLSATVILILTFHHMKD